MRMWMLPPATLCRKHLLGEHVETHMLAGHIAKGRALGKFITDSLVDPHSVNTRHDALAAEMVSRGYKHASPLPPVDVTNLPAGRVDSLASKVDLHARCPACKDRWKV